MHGNTIELEHPIPEMDGQRVRVMLEAVEEQKLSAQRQSDLWRTWIEDGPQGPIEEGADTDIP